MTDRAPSRRTARTGRARPAEVAAGRGPTDIHDSAIRHEAKRAAVWIAMAVFAGLALWLTQPLLVIFGGIVFAAMIDGGQRLVARVLPVARGLRIAIVLLAALAFLVWLVLFAGSQIADQAAAMPALVKSQAVKIEGFARAHGLVVNRIDFQRLAEQLAGGVGPVTQALGGIVGALANAFLIVILGIYFAIEPDLYRRGLGWLLPVESRDHWHETAEAMGKSLRRLLFGRLLGMSSEGFATWLLLWFGGVPMAALLGLLTALLAFLPNIGAPISGALMMLVGFSGGMHMGIYCLVVYLVVQIVDGNIVVPMVARRTVDLAPALVLGAQLIFGVVFGLLGLILADPMVAMLKVALERQALRNGAPPEKEPA